MGTPHRWHPGTGRLRGRWTLSTPLLPDEIASSWLVRLARVQGCDVLALTGELWPDWRCWTQDLDRGVSAPRIGALASATGIDADAFHAATLGPVIERVAEIDGRARTRWPWTTTLGSRNTRRHGGLQCCPACLADDVVPYYRLGWRLAWHSLCDVHGLVLLDRCPACRSPLEPHRLEIRDASNTLCATCSEDLRSGTTCEAAPAGLDFQRMADAAAREGTARAFSRVATSRDWFALAAFLATFLRRSSYVGGGPLRRVLAGLEMSAPTLALTERGVDLESLRSANRHALFAALGPLLDVERDALVVALADARITRQALCPQGTTLPSVLEDIIKALPERTVPGRSAPTKKTSGPRSRRAVETMMGALERRLARRHARRDG